MDAEQPRIVIEFNPVTSDLSFLVNGHAVESSWRLSECKEIDADELERQVGGSVLALLSLEAGHSVGNRDYLSGLRDYSRDVIRMYKQKLAEGDESLIVYLVQRLCAISANQLDGAALLEAEAVLKEAVAKGNRFAIEYMDESWELERQSVIELLDARDK